MTTASAFTLGCKNAQSQSKMYSSRAEIGMNMEIKFLNMGNYLSAYQFYRKANEDYRNWEDTVLRSPKCFRTSDISKTKRVLKLISSFQTMSSRYGVDIARRNNYGSLDPCFRYLGEDNAYLQCSIENSQP